MSSNNFIRNIAYDLRETGLVVMGAKGDVSSGTYSYAHTIGLSEKFGFELLVVGLSVDSAKKIFGNIANMPAFPAMDVPVTHCANRAVMFKDCVLYLDVLHNHYVRSANLYYDRKVDVVQMVLSDRNGRLPGHRDFDQAYMSAYQRLFFAPSPLR